MLGIIAVLIGTLTPALIAARRASQQTACAANLRTIGQGLLLYTDAYRGLIHRSPDRSSWLRTWAPAGQPSALRLIDSGNVNAYWGVAYFPFLASRKLSEATGGEASQIIEHARKIWLCPSSVSVDDAFGAVVDDPVSYGVNFRVTGGETRIIGTNRYTTWAKLTQFRPASEVIFAQDSVEQRMEGDAGDTLSSYGGPTNLADWRPDGGGTGYSTRFKTDAVFEYYRHHHSSNVLWLDGHVSAIAESRGADVPSRWYDGK